MAEEEEEKSATLETDSRPQMSTTPGVGLADDRLEKTGKLRKQL